MPSGVTEISVAGGRPQLRKYARRIVENDETSPVFTIQAAEARFARRAAFVRRLDKRSPRYSARGIDPQIYEAALYAVIRS